jgi:hypothetical protein
VINEVDNRHLGYIIRETTKFLGPYLKDNIFAAARGILSKPRHPCYSLNMISCHVLLFFAGPPHQLAPPLPPQLDFHNDLSSSHFMLVGNPVAFTGCTLDDYDSYVARYMPLLQLQCQVSTNVDSPVHVHDGDATAPLYAPKFQTRSQTQTQAGTQFEVQGTTQRIEVQCPVEQPFSHPCSTNVDSPVHLHDGDATAPLYAPKFQTQSQTQTQAGTQFKVQGTTQRIEVQCPVEQPFSHPCSTNVDSPVHLHDGDATAPLDSPKFQTQSQTQTQAGTRFEVQGTAQRNEVQCRVEQPFSHPCSTNVHTPVHLHDCDATIPLNCPKFQTQRQTQTQTRTQFKVQGTAQKNEVICMKCKQMGGGPFFQCAQSRCPVLIHESCICSVVHGICIFCQFLACRRERLEAEKDSDFYVALKEKYVMARKFAIRYFGKNTFMGLRELAGLDPLLPTPVQEPCIVNMQCHTLEGDEEEAVITRTNMVKVAAKEKKEKVKVAARSSRAKNLELMELAGCGKRILPPRQSLSRSCKQRRQHYDHLGNHSSLTSGLFLPEAVVTIKGIKSFFAFFKEDRRKMQSAISYVV